jgi:hypothetical protein
MEAETLLYRLFVLAAVVGFLWWALRLRYSLRIVINRGNIVLGRGVPKASAEPSGGHIDSVGGPW